MVSTYFLLFVTPYPNWKWIPVLIYSFQVFGWRFNQKPAHLVNFWDFFLFRKSNQQLILKVHGSILVVRSSRWNVPWAVVRIVLGLGVGGAESESCIWWWTFLQYEYIYIYIPSRELTYPTWGKGTSSSKCHFWWDMLVLSRVSRWWFQILGYFHPDPWGDDPICINLTRIFQMGWFNHQLVYLYRVIWCYMCGCTVVHFLENNKHGTRKWR